MKTFLLMFAVCVSLWAQPAAISNDQGHPGSKLVNVDGTTGVTAGHYVKLNAGGTGFILGATTDSCSLYQGIATATQTGGTELIVLAGPYSPIAFDGSATIGHWATCSSTVNGDLTDAGTTKPSNAVGIIQVTIGSAGNTTVDLQGMGGGVTIASGTAALGTSLITTGACASVVTVSATGTLTTDVIVYTPNADPTGVTGYAVSATGSLYIWAYPTANNVNFKVCNNTAGSLTPSALTLNWRVAR
jgi:hypothetical protein